MRISSWLAVVVCVGSWVGCGTTAPVLPPPIDPAGLDEALDQDLDAFVDGVAVAVGPRRVVLQGFYDAEMGHELRMSSYITPRIVRELGKRGVKVVERKDLDKVLDEQIRQGSDHFQLEAQSRLGRLVGADLLLLCPVTRPSKHLYRSDWKLTDVTNGMVEGGGTLTLDRRKLPPRYGGTL